MSVLSLDRKILISVDKLICKSVKKFLHLLATTPSACIYAASKERSIGVMSFLESIPVILLRRLNNISLLEHYYYAVFSSEWGPNLLSMFKTRFVRNGKTPRAFVTTYHKPYSVLLQADGIRQGSHSADSNSWLSDPPKFWSSADFITAVELKVNLLLILSAPHNRGQIAKFRVGCDKTKCFSHALQGYPHWPIKVKNRFVPTLNHINK